MKKILLTLLIYIAYCIFVQCENDKLQESLVIATILSKTVNTVDPITLNENKKMQLLEENSNEIVLLSLNAKTKNDFLFHDFRFLMKYGMLVYYSTFIFEIVFNNLYSNEGASTMYSGFSIFVFNRLNLYSYPSWYVNSVFVFFYFLY